MDYKKVFLNEIPNEGLVLAFSLPASEIDIQIENSKLADEVSFKGSIQRFGERFILSGRLESRWIFQCDRCLKSYECLMETPVLMHYVEQKDDGRIASHTFKDTDEEPEEIVKDAINLLDALKEQLILQLPMKMLCSDTCKGLCPQCGHNLNKGDCKCPPPVTDSRFSKLKDLLEK
ncbi:MAG: DUF177 domain-containing protein [bacterium]